MERKLKEIQEICHAATEKGLGPEREAYLDACPSEKPYPDEKLKPRLMYSLICYPCPSRQMD